VLNAVMRVKGLEIKEENTRSVKDFIDLFFLHAGNNQHFRLLKNKRLVEIFTQI
jgi:hypothetical protein